jgi:hypothetical protein
VQAGFERFLVLNDLMIGSTKNHRPPPLFVYGHVDDELVFHKISLAFNAAFILTVYK